MTEHMTAPPSRKLEKLITHIAKDRVFIASNTDAWAKNYSLFDVHGEEFANFEQADAVSKALLALGEDKEPRLIGYNMVKNNWYRIGEIDGQA
jgi:hypothetical protein